MFSCLNRIFNWIYIAKILVDRRNDQSILAVRQFFVKPVAEFSHLVDVNTRMGTKPLPEPTSIQKMLLLMIVQLCRKILFIDPNIKVGLYITLVLFGSSLSDVLPIPGSYFSRKNNLFNVYFVKLSWAWSMAFVGSFVYLTSNVYCCGDKVKIGKHLLRLFVATVNWYLWTRLFDYVEDKYMLINYT